MVGIDMAIIIPSSKTYDRQNPKVRDNVIERIEVETNTVVPDNKYDEVVYNAPISYIEQNDKESVDFVGMNVDYKPNTPTTEEYVRGVAIIYSQITGIYFSGTLNIPKLKNNSYISKIFTGVEKLQDSSEEAEVKYSSKCIKKQGSFSIDANIPSGSSTNIKVDKNSIKRVIDNSVIDTAILEQKLELFNEAKIDEEVETGGGLVSVYANISKTLVFNDNKTNLKKLTVEEITIENVEYYRFNFTVLCGAIFDKVSNSYSTAGYLGEEPEPPEENPEYPSWLNGTTTYYIPETIEFSIYGNSIGIDLTDNVVKIGDSTSKKAQTVERNELMQTQNYTEIPIDISEFNITSEEKTDYIAVTISFVDGKPKNEYVHLIVGGERMGIIAGSTSLIAGIPLGATPIIEKAWVQKNSAIDYNFSKTLEDYNKGKETATIRCSIGDYYEVTKAKVQSYSEEDYGAFCVLNVGSVEKAEYYHELTISSNGVEGFVSDYDDNNIFVRFFSKTILNKLDLGEIEIEHKEISTNYSARKMSFDLYDQVIPMVYGANGKDRPMSLYKDGTPKVFQVLGKKVFYDGAVWQELTLQEI